MEIKHDVKTYRQWVYKLVDNYLRSNDFEDRVLLGDIADLAIRKGPDTEVEL
jgi:hypothetical protein